MAETPSRATPVNSTTRSTVGSRAAFATPKRSAARSGDLIHSHALERVKVRSATAGPARPSAAARQLLAFGVPMCLRPTPCPLLLTACLSGCAAGQTPPAAANEPSPKADNRAPQPAANDASA